MAEGEPAGSSLHIGGVRVAFPRQAYGAQLAMMGQIIRACTRREHALLELPTGSGKSLALLCASLAWRAHEAEALRAEQPAGRARAAPRVIVASRTHSQLKQLVRELRSTSYRPRVVVLGSREQLCVSKKARADATRRGCSLNDACQRALLEGSCGHVHAASKLKSAPELEPPALPDLEDVVAAARGARACAYFGTRLRTPRAELVLCPYNYLLDPQVRASSDLDALLDGAAIVVDEAHALEDASREAASAQLTLRALRDAAAALEGARDHEALAELSDEVAVLHDLADALCSWLMATSRTLRATSFETESRCWTGARAARSQLEEVGLRAETLELVNGAWTRVSAKLAERGGGEHEEDERARGARARARAPGGARGGGCLLYTSPSPRD